MDQFRAVYEKLRSKRDIHPAASILYDRWQEGSDDDKRALIDKYGLVCPNLTAKDWRRILEEIHNETKPTVEKWERFYIAKKALYEQALTAEKAKAAVAKQALEEALTEEKAKTAAAMQAADENKQKQEQLDELLWYCPLAATHGAQLTVKERKILKGTSIFHLFVHLFFVCDIQSTTCWILLNQITNDTHQVIMGHHCRTRHHRLRELAQSNPYLEPQPLKRGYMQMS